MTQELRKLAEAAKGWLIRPSIVQETADDILKLGHTSEDGEFYELIEIDCENYDQPSRPLAEFIAAANPAAVLALLDERDQLQAECAEHKENAIRNARIAVSIRAERDALRKNLEEVIRAHPVSTSLRQTDAIIAAREAIAVSAEPEIVAIEGMPTGLGNEPEILAEYTGINGVRQWASTGAWLYPGEAIAVISDHFPDAKKMVQAEAQPQAVASSITLAQLVQAMSERDLPPEVTQKIAEQIAGLALSDPATEQFLRRLLAGSQAKPPEART